MSPNTDGDGGLTSAPIDIEKKNAEKEAQKKVEGTKMLARFPYMSEYNYLSRSILFNSYSN